MSDLSAAQVIADFIETLDGHDEVCDCGRPEVHILFALAAAGYAVVKLPPSDHLGQELAKWGPNTVWVHEWPEGPEVLHGRALDNVTYPPAYARQLAAALLAAADHAERVS